MDGCIGVFEVVKFHTKRHRAQIGLSDEHKNLYKLFSKVVHPSSYLVNDYKNAASIETRMILQTRAQLYAWDTFSRVCEYFNVPGELRENATHN